MRIHRNVAVSLAAVAVLLAGGAGLASAGGDDDAQPAPGLVPANVAPAAAIGSSEQSFVPVDPCRLADTRKAGGIIAAGATRSYEVRGGTGFVPQGGTSGGCGVPIGATAVELTVAAVGPATRGYVRAFPTGGSPQATTITYQKGVDVLNTGAVSMCVGPSCTKDVSIKVYDGATHIVLDVTGYYAPPMWASVSSSGVVARGSRVVSGARIGEGQFEVIFDRDITACAYIATLGGPTTGSTTGQIVASQRVTNSAGLFVSSSTSTGTLSDRAFFLSVVC